MTISRDGYLIVTIGNIGVDVVESTGIFNKYCTQSEKYEASLILIYMYNA